MKEISMDISIGHLVLQYGAGGESTITFSPKYLHKLKMAGWPCISDVFQDKLIVDYLLDEGFPVGYNLPFKILNYTH